MTFKVGVEMLGPRPPACRHSLTSPKVAFHDGILLLAVQPTWMHAGHSSLPVAEDTSVASRCSLEHQITNDR